MKKIRYKTKADEKKKQKLIYGLLIAFIMVTSVLGYFGSRGNSSYRYNNIKFTRLPNTQLFVTKIKGMEFRFHYLPQWVDNLTIPQEIIAKIRDSQVMYTTYDYNSSFATVDAEVEFYLTEALSEISKYVLPGFITRTNTKRPLITCANATASVPVIYLGKSNITELRLNNSCITFKAPTRAEFLAYKDRLLYGVLGIIQ